MDDERGGDNVWTFLGWSSPKVRREPSELRASRRTRPAARPDHGRFAASASRVPRPRRSITVTSGSGACGLPRPGSPRKVRGSETTGALPAAVEVAVVGAGFGGLGAAIELDRAGFHDVAVLERAPEIGGTWYANSYPGCQCDVPSN